MPQTADFHVRTALKLTYTSIYRSKKFFSSLPLAMTGRDKGKGVKEGREREKRIWLPFLISG